VTQTSWLQVELYVILFHRTYQENVEECNESSNNAVYTRARARVCVCARPSPCSHTMSHIKSSYKSLNMEF